MCGSFTWHLCQQAIRNLQAFRFNENLKNNLLFPNIYYSDLVDTKSAADSLFSDVYC